ncbi:DUF1173 domain-containing protein [Aldersonia kunmingensis]|uniref:DUF1173 domain-containing protein n=1 Tax=Aldersonia kunmingensis TaxID=408066 RepID=UPI000834103F|nr:DUF1173 domain-containing protein [Aldersonia kunmingensis]
MTRYRIDGHTVDADDEERLQPLLAHAHRATGSTGTRPVCLCRNGRGSIAPGPAMYVARINGIYILKRMPGTGTEHAPQCRSYDPPPEVSGAGEVLGSAITLSPGDGATRLTLGFSLTRAPGRAAPTATADTDPTSAHTDGTKLTIRALLHFLWDEGGLTRWDPAVAGRRNWSLIRRDVLHAAQDKVAKGQSLTDALYVPESFDLDHKYEIAARRASLLRQVAAPSKGRHKLLLLVAEVKTIAPARFGYKVVFKHVPDCPFLLPEDLHRRLHKAFDIELALWEAVEHTHLVAAATFAVSPAGIPTLDQIALMPTTDAWIPFESVFDKTLLDTITAARRPFRKTLRYNMTRDKPLASLVVLDTDPATACYIADADHAPAHERELVDLIADSSLASWIWNPTTASALPPLPDRSTSMERSPA